MMHFNFSNFYFIFMCIILITHCVKALPYKYEEDYEYEGEPEEDGSRSTAEETAVANLPLMVSNERAERSFYTDQLKSTRLKHSSKENVKQPFINPIVYKRNTENSEFLPGEAFSFNGIKDTTTGNDEIEAIHGTEEELSDEDNERIASEISKIFQLIRRDTPVGENAPSSTDTKEGQSPIESEQLNEVEKTSNHNNLTPEKSDPCLQTLRNQSKEDSSISISKSNLTEVLERVLQELQSIKLLAKGGTSTPEGIPCDIQGVWNSEIIGLKFDITVVNSSKQLAVKLSDRSPARRGPSFIEADWRCSGSTLQERGGPFYLTAFKPKQNVLATFAGICKKCDGADTIFGTWSLIRPAKECRDIQTAIDIKRDIFRRATVLRQGKPTKKTN